MPLPSSLESWSFAAREALNHFENTAASLRTLQAQVSTFDQELRSGRLSQVGTAKTRLAHLETFAKKLESDIDDVIISNLNSGREMAREVRRGQLERLDRLFGQIDQLFGDLKDKEAKGGTKDSPKHKVTAPSFEADQIPYWQKGASPTSYGHVNMGRSISDDVTDVPDEEELDEDVSESDSWGGLSSGSERRGRLVRKCCCWMPKAVRGAIFGA